MKSGYGTARIYKLKTTLPNGAFPYTVPEDFDPVFWEPFEPGVRRQREDCGNGLADPDLHIGDVIAGGVYAGMYVVEALSPSGCFFAVEGENRPTFVSGGVQQDMIRNIRGLVGWMYNNNSPMPSGAFYPSSFIGWALVNGSGCYFAELDVSRVAPTSPDNVPLNLSYRLWRRVS